MGKCEIHICPPNDYRPNTGGGNAYIICNEIDEYYRNVRAAGAKIQREPEERIYGMRDFIIIDPDGNQISFGCDS